ncbi:hypothetical protein HPP92_002286 [Vanilla planifolia]|uniref:WAT1-related protein n=1 Tax=Vanilla planifolia TaxID=51239 RepID=A0A835S652_VANPL|nr:hypothetical protein HPP92_002286 [Vanilla planifolia]
MMVQFGLLALGGVTMFQALLMLGIKRTTPAVASAMPNLVPGFVFLMAAILRYEKFSIWCKYSMAKVLGTIVCLGGAIAMSFLQSPALPKMLTILNATYDNTYKDWMMGCFYLLAAVIIVSCIMVLQAATMVNFPAPFSLYVLTTLMGSILTAFVQIIVEGKFDVGTPNLSILSIISIIAAGSAISSICIVYQTWCVSKKGPLLVSIFSPVQTVCATSFSTILFGQAIGVGSSIGMILMFIGLYIVLWAKTKEGVQSKKSMPLDVEKPLLS